MLLDRIQSPANRNISGEATLARWSLDIEEKERGLHSAAWIALSSERLATPTASQPFVPAVGQAILLGRDLGVFPEEINELELRLSDEA